MNRAMLNTVVIEELWLIGIRGLYVLCRTRTGAGSQNIVCRIICCPSIEGDLCSMML
jgi:hypothetical protein